MKPSIPFTPEILNSDMKTVYVIPLYAKPFDIITYFEIKTIFGELINQLESVFLGTFGKSFCLDGSDDELFKKLYPYMYDKLRECYGDTCLNTLSRALDTFRNYNMHARTHTFQKSFNDLVKLVKLLPNYSNDIIYYKEERLTFAGMLVILLLLSSELMIKYLIKNHMWDNFIEHLRLFGPEPVEENEFASKLLSLSKANFEINIRENDKKETDIIETIFGRFAHKVKVEGEKFKYFSGYLEDNSEYWCSGEIKQDENALTIKVNRGSYFPEFYESDYSLTVENRELFIEYCKSLPPFVFITFLYHLKANKFNNTTIPEDKKQIIHKLNHPKFYVDKNINTLLLPGTISDLRLASQIVAAGLNYCFIKLENELYSKFHLTYEGYTTLRSALAPFGFDQGLLNNVISIRNFFAHHHILGDNVKYGKRQFQKIDLVFVYITINHLITEMEKKDPQHAEYLRKNFFYKIIMNLVYMKYFDSYRNTNNLLKTNDLPTLIDTMKKAEFRIKNSYLTEVLENNTALFVKNKDVAFGYYENGRKTFDIIYLTTIVSNSNLILKNGKDTGVKELQICTFVEPKIEDIFNYVNCEKGNEEKTKLLVKRKYLLN